MKFSHRLLLTLLLTFGIFLCAALLSLHGRGDKLLPDRRSSPVDLDLGPVRRLPDTVSYDRIPTLLRRVLAQSRSRDLWQTLLRNQSVAEAWIRIGRLLEHRNGFHGDGASLRVEEDSRVRLRFGNHDNQFVLDGVLDRNETEALMRLLYEAVGYRNDRVRTGQFDDHLLNFRDR